MHPKLISVLRSKWTIPVVGSAVSMGIGIAAGYFIAKKRLVEEETVEIIVEEDFQLRLVFDEPEYVDTPRFVIDENNFPMRVKEEEGGEESMINVFTEADEDWDYELEVSYRDEETPYIIHRDEFFADELGWDSQSTLTYYAVDGVLVDGMDEPLMNHRFIVGDLKFGHGSGDPNVCYVRNHKLHAEYEVLQDPGSYEIDVLGYHVENEMERDDIRHARSPGKFPRE